MNAGMFGQPPGMGPPGGGGRPLRIVDLKSGSGTFVPLTTGSWCRVTLLGAGGGSGSNATTNGGGGASSASVFWIRLAGPVPYVVGAGGVGSTTTAGSAGGASKFANVTQPGGLGGFDTGTNGVVLPAVIASGSGMPGNGSGAHIGGSTAYGTAGATAGAAGTGFGAGGSGNNTAAAAGLGGLIIIEEFGP